MQNMNYVPFERNHYYYGKLMTVEDFLLEQRYMNNKRWHNNRFFHGMGVIFGLNVISVDEQTISVTPGYAFDHGGREVILDQTIVKKLSNFSGFPQIKEQDASYVYLCISYEEEKNEIVYNVAGEDQSSDGNEFNKCRESCRLTLTCNEPKDIRHLDIGALYENKSIVYSGNGIRISHIVPKFVQANASFEMTVEIENIGQQQPFAFSYDLELSHLKYKNNAHLKVNFDEKLHDKAYKYRKTYQLTALEAFELTASMKISDSTVKVVIMDEIKNEISNEKTQTYITSGNRMKKLEEHFFENQMDLLLNSTGMQNIYLAKIFLIEEGDVYVIQHVEQMPFDQYVWSSGLSYINQRILHHEVASLNTKVSEMQKKTDQGEGNEEGEKKHLSFGTCQINIPGRRQKGRVILSEEISHGLGIGEVNITLGIGKSDNETIWGIHRIFPDVEPKAELGAKVYLDRGTFVIGVKLLDVCSSPTCKLYWRAERNPENIKEESMEKGIIMEPNFINLSIGQTVYIQAECRNMNDKRLSWSVEKYGGIIDKNGMYTAPDREGIFEITAASFVYPNVSASVYAVVRSRNALRDKEDEHDT